MYEVSYITTRVARVHARDPESAKRRFAAYVLYDEVAAIESDVQLSYGDDAELTPAAGAAPAAGSRAELRTWFARRDEHSERFEASVYEDPERTLDTYLRLLATNDPWRLEGHGSLGRTLSAVRVFAGVTTFDRRIHYRFDATQYLDYVRLDSLTALDPARPQESVSIENLIDVSALHDDVLRQIASSYEAIVREHTLTARYIVRSAPEATSESSREPTFLVTFEADDWRSYLAHRLAEPERFLPPPGWVSAFATYDAD